MDKDEPDMVPASEMVGGKILNVHADTTALVVTVELPEPRVLSDVKLVGDIVLDPAHTPPWPGAGITHVDGKPVSERHWN